MLTCPVCKPAYCRSGKWEVNVIEPPMPQTITWLIVWYPDCASQNGILSGKAYQRTMKVGIPSGRNVAQLKAHSVSGTGRGRMTSLLTLLSFNFVISTLLCRILCSCMWLTLDTSQYIIWKSTVAAACLVSSLRRHKFKTRVNVSLRRSCRCNTVHQDNCSRDQYDQTTLQAFWQNILSKSSKPVTRHCLNDHIYRSTPFALH